MLEISTSDIFTWLFQRSLSSSFLKVWPCGSLLTEHTGEFLRNSDPRAAAYRVGICREDQSLCILITSTESTIQSKVHEHYFHVYVLVPVWLMQTPFLSADYGINCGVRTRNTKALCGCIDEQSWNSGYMRLLMGFNFCSFPRTFLVKFRGRLLVFSPLSPGCTPSALVVGIYQYAL